MTVFLKPFVVLPWIEVLAIIVYFIATILRTLNVTALQVQHPAREDFAPTEQGENLFDFASRDFNRLHPKHQRAANISLYIALVSGLIGAWGLVTIIPVTSVQTGFGDFSFASFGLWLAVVTALLIHFAAFGVARFAFYRYS